MKKIIAGMVLFVSCNENPHIVSYTINDTCHEYIVTNKGMSHWEDCRFCHQDNPEGNPE